MKGKKEKILLDTLPCRACGRTAGYTVNASFEAYGTLHGVQVNMQGILAGYTEQNVESDGEPEEDTLYIECSHCGEELPQDDIPALIESIPSLNPPKKKETP